MLMGWRVSPRHAVHWSVLVLSLLQLACHGEFKPVPDKESSVSLSELATVQPKGLFYLEGAITSRRLGVGTDQFCTRKDIGSFGDAYSDWDDFDRECQAVVVVPLISTTDVSETPAVLAWLAAGADGGPNWNGQKVLAESASSRLVWAPPTAAAKRARAKVCSSGGACALSAPIYYQGEVYNGGCMGLGPKSWLVVALE